MAKIRGIRNALALAGLVAVAVTPSRAQVVEDVTVNLSGTYTLEDVTVSEDSVSLTFRATILNNGPADVEGFLKLAEPNNLQRPLADFGSVSISAGGKIDVDSTADVPRSVYNSWSSTQPTLNFAWQTDRGDILVRRVSLSRMAPRQ